MEGLVSIQDKITPFRINTILSSFVNVIEMSSLYWKDTLLCLEELIVLGAESDSCAAWLQEKSETTLKWVIPWLESRPRAPSSLRDWRTADGEKIELQKRTQREDYYSSGYPNQSVPG